MRHGYRFLALIILLLSLNPMPALAQNGVPIDSLNVALWPEYDRPEMLVIYKVELSSDLPLPAELTLRIPAAAGEPNAVASRDVDGGLYNVAYEREMHGEWAEITFIAPSQEAQLEYYDPGLRKEDDNRTYTYTWPGDYAVSSLSFQVQQPAGAEEFTLVPGLGDGVPGTDGLTYFSAEVGSLSAGDNFSLTVAYQKGTDALSVELADRIQVQPVDPLTAETPGRVSMLDVLPWLLAILAVLLIVGGMLWFWRRSNQELAPASTGRRGRRRSARPTSPESRDEAGVYCHQCGKRAAPGDNFCRVCGTKLRST